MNQRKNGLKNHFIKKRNLILQIETLLAFRRNCLMASTVLYLWIFVFMEVNRILLDDITVYALRRVFNLSASNLLPFSRSALSLLCFQVECSVLPLCIFACDPKFRQFLFEMFTKPFCGRGNEAESRQRIIPKNSLEL